MPQSPTTNRSSILSRQTLANCFLRSSFLLAGMNTKGMQNIGFSAAIDPALRDLYPSYEELQEARLRYAPHFNCHPFLTPYILGVFIHSEKNLIAGKLPPATYNAIRNTYTYTLSVIGDNLLSGGIYITCSLLLCIIMLAGNITLALAFFICSLLVFHALKFTFFVVGLRHGLNSMQWLEHLQPITLAEKCKFVNAFLLALLFYQIALYLNTPVPVFPLGILGLLLVCLVVQKAVPLSRIISGLAFFLLIGLFTYVIFSLQ